MCGGLAKGYVLAWVRLRVLGISGTVPLSLQKNAKGGEKVTQLACGSNKCPLSSNAFSRAPRGSQPPKSGATVPEASPPLCTGMPGLAVFVPEGQKGAGVCGRVKNIWNFLNGIVMVRIYM